MPSRLPQPPPASLVQSSPVNFSQDDVSEAAHGECVSLRDEVEMNDKLPNAVIKLVDELGLAFGAPPKPGKEREPFINALVAVARFAQAVGSREAQWESSPYWPTRCRISTQGAWHPSSDQRNAKEEAHRTAASPGSCASGCWPPWTR